MATVTISWSPNDSAEQVTGYAIYQDAVKVQTVAASPATLPSVVPGAHNFAVAAVNLWGEGPKSDAYVTPPAASKPQITVLVQVP